MKKLTLTISALTLLALAAGILWYQKVYMPSHEQNAVAQRVCSEPGMRTFSHAGLAFCYPESEKISFAVNTEDYLDGIFGSIHCGNAGYKFRGKIFTSRVSPRLTHNGIRKIFDGKVTPSDLGQLAQEVGIRLPTNEDNEIHKEIVTIGGRQVMHFFSDVDRGVTVPYSVKIGDVHKTESQIQDVQSHFYAFFVGRNFVFMGFHEPICDRNAIEKIVASFRTIN